MSDNNNGNKEEIMKKFVIAGTGSRELITDVEKFRNVYKYLTDLLIKAKEKHGDNLWVISGMAEGFDEALACAAIAANVPFTAAIPNKGYIQYYWQKTSMTGLDRFKEAQEILDKASEIIYVCSGIYGPDGRYANYHRNEWMVDRADIVWVYNPTTRGTAQCYKYCNDNNARTFLIPIPTNPERSEISGTYTRGQELGNGVCNVCRKRFEHTFVVTIENKTKAIKQQWCNECFEETKLIADHSADMSR